MAIENTDLNDFYPGSSILERFHYRLSSVILKSIFICFLGITRLVLFVLFYIFLLSYYILISNSMLKKRLFVFVALRPKSTAMVIAGRSVHITTLFPGQA